MFAFHSAAILLLCITQTAASATYSLYRDGILSLALTTPTDDGATHVPLVLLQDLLDEVIKDIVHIYSVTSYNLTNKVSLPNVIQDDDLCFVAKNDISCKTHGYGGKCVTQRMTKEGDMDVDVQYLFVLIKGRVL